MNPLKAIEREVDDIVKNDEDEKEDTIPASDFCNFLPWACLQLEIPVYLIVTQEQQNEYVPITISKESKKLKAKKSQLMKAPANSTDDNANASGHQKDMTSDDFLINADEPVVHITAVYSGEHLVQIKFVKNKHIPREIFKVIGLITQFYVRLYGITMDSGVDQYTAYELNHLLLQTNITEICLDNTFLPEANYHILLDNATQLKHLSLARCKMGDQAVIILASKLEPPSPASKILSILNLSSNRITNVGAKHLAYALRTNRQLSYLSLAGNLLSDDGAEAILNSLKIFRFTYEEVLMSKSKYMEFLRNKFEVIQRVLDDLKHSGKVGIGRAYSATDKSKTNKKPQIENPKSKIKSPKEKPDDLYEKAVKIASEYCGEYDDPMVMDCTVVDNCLCANGNNTLACLNLAYNSLSYLILPILLDVVKCQRDLDRVPRGLVNVSLEGNPLPEMCKELIDIDDILRSGLSINRGSFVKKEKKFSRKKSEMGID